jgi:hypothetical protein
VESELYSGETVLHAAIIHGSVEEVSFLTSLEMEMEMEGGAEGEATVAAPARREEKDKDKNVGEGKEEDMVVDEIANRDSSEEQSDASYTQQSQSQSQSQTKSESVGMATCHIGHSLAALSTTGSFFAKGSVTYFGESPLLFAVSTNQWVVVGTHHTHHLPSM